MEHSCYVYAILRREASIPADLAGLNDAPLSLVSWLELAVAVSPIEGTRIAPTPASLLRHEAVVERLCQAGPALPVRFGTILADAQAVVQALAGQYEVLCSDLARVGDKVELGLTILWGTTAAQDEAASEQQTAWTSDTPADGTPGAGTRYLQARLAYYRREAARKNTIKLLLADLEQRLRPYALEQRTSMLPGPRLAARAAYLVHPDQVKAFQQAVDELRQGHPDLRWLISGPWPPYSFVTRAGKPFQQSPGLKLDRVKEEGGKS
jgi:hypothetical protein